METLAADVATGQKLTISTAVHVIHGETSLKLSDGDPSPVLVAHPGSPVDISDHERPSLATSRVPARSYRSHAEFMDGEISPPTDRMEKSIKWSGVAAKGDTMEMEGMTSEDLTPTPTPTPSRGNQSFYFPKSPDDEQGQTITTPVAAGDGPQNPAAETSWFYFDFGFEAGPQLPAATLDNDSKSSLTSTTTAVSGPNNRRFSHGALTVDTSVASSATSMASSEMSVCSAVTNTADIYGWEEELDRRMSVSHRAPAAPVLARRATSGATCRYLTPRFPVDMYTPPPKRVDMKRKSLLHRVLNIRRGMDESYPPGAPAPEYPTTSA
jgi:hypothetical protein